MYSGEEAVEACASVHARARRTALPWQELCDRLAAALERDRSLHAAQEALETDYATVKLVRCWARAERFY